MVRSIEYPFLEWCPGETTVLSPYDNRFLASVCEAGFQPIRGPGNSFGGLSDVRGVFVIHRGRLKRWEIILGDSDLKHEVASKITERFDELVSVAMKWLGGCPEVEAHELLEPL